MLNSDVFSVVNMYLDHLKLCVVCINGRRCVCYSECYVVYYECDEPTPALCNISMRTVVKLCTFESCWFRGELSFLNCVDIRVCLVNKQFQLLGFVFNSVYVD